MCNGNVAPKRTRSPANPHEWEQKSSSSLAFRHAATLADGIIKLKILKLASVIWTQEGRRVNKCFTRVLLALECTTVVEVK